MAIRTSDTIYEGIIDPSGSDNFSAGFQVGDDWRNTVSGKVFHCQGDGSWINMTDALAAAGAGGTTNLSEGTSTPTTVDVNSSTGTNATLQPASTSRAGLMPKAKFDEVVANNSKVSNATHTGDVTGATALTIANNAVTNAKAAQMAANTIKANATGGAANQSDLPIPASTFLARLSTGNLIAATVAQVKALIGNFTSVLAGLVPASGGGTTNFLRADGTWAVPSLTSFSVQATSTVTTSSTTDVIMTGMTVTPGAGNYLVMFNCVFRINSAIDRDNHFSVYVNGVAVPASLRHIETTNSTFPEVMTVIVKVSGVLAAQAIDIRYRTENGGDVLSIAERTLNLIKL